MRVRCIRLARHDGTPVESSSWLTLGRVYGVLEVVVDGERWLVRIVGDAPNGVALFRLDEFAILSAVVPGSWTVNWHNARLLILGPAAWQKPGFWERYLDQDPEAMRVFDEECRRVVNSEGP
jgi:hypothetical protein